MRYKIGLSWFRNWSKVLAAVLFGSVMVSFAQQQEGRWEIQTIYIDDNQGGYLNIEGDFEISFKHRFCQRVRCPQNNSEHDCSSTPPCNPCGFFEVPECIVCGEWIHFYNCSHSISIFAEGDSVFHACWTDECVTSFNARHNNNHGLLWAMSNSARTSSAEHPGPGRGSQTAEGKTYIKLVWRSNNTKPPDTVSARTLASVIANAKATNVPNTASASARAKAAIGNVSVTANISSNPNIEETTEADIGWLSKELDVQQDSNGQYYVVIDYPVTLETKVDSSSEASKDYCVFPAVEVSSDNNGDATAIFDRVADLFSAGDTVLLISGTALVDGAGAICDVDLCSLQPATGQIAHGIPFPLIDVAHTGYTFHSAPSHSVSPFYGLESIRVVYDSAAEVGDIRLQSFWRDKPVVPTWETRPYQFNWSNVPSDDQPLRERWVSVYDANGVALRFRATEQLPAGNWIYEGAQGVFSTLKESATQNSFILTGGPPGAMRAIGAWTYIFEPITGLDVGGQVLSRAGAVISPRSSILWGMP